MMKHSAYRNNQKSNVILTAEKLSGRGVLCSKSAVHLLRVFREKVNCIFVVEDIEINNKPLTN